MYAAETAPVVCRERRKKIAALKFNLAQIQLALIHSADVYPVLLIRLPQLRFVWSYDMNNVLRDLWYLAMPSTKLRVGKTVALTLLGEPVLIGRRGDGRVFAFYELCPHRGMPLRHAIFENDALRCCFHGWKFDVANGRCREIPGLSEHERIDVGRFQLQAYPCREVQGNIWVFMAAGKRRAPTNDTLPSIPTVPTFAAETIPQLTATSLFPCNADQAVIGFMDPVHPPFVHTSRWWKPERGSLHQKEKHYEPTPLGFRMKPHRVINAGSPYRLLGNNVTAEITVQLPGIRIEHIRGDRHTACILAAATPVDDTTTAVHYCLYWSMYWLKPLKPIAHWMLRDFLHQDRNVAAKLRASVPYSPSSMLVGDPDTQIKWYFRIKQEFQSSVADGRAFVNPVRAQTLKWRS